MSGEASTSSLAVAEPEVIDLTGLDEEDSDQDDQEDGSEDEDSEHFSDDSSDSAEVQINRDSRTRLYLALAAISETQIRSILNQLIEQVPAVEYALTRELVTLKRKLNHDYERHIERCTNCHEEFDTHTKRSNTECSFHPGSLKPNWNSFPDWDEDVHGPIDAEETRREYPENFMWSCCKEDGESEGCVHGAHQSANPHKKARVAA
ncbi:hypothetical protein C8J55DRAFT_556046 [Lentinula edodes]|uniref:C2H2-type domain-containing protein n=1 Tax=Lentinula lateritia TaxID=40482 RepID=A0A9W9AY11_9AGAR|nr:hypothetical protein C8J55DRAFT_556046 [Lentinula edodes]